MPAHPPLGTGLRIEHLRQLSDGPFGVLCLSRVLNGPDFGRLVTSRRLLLSRLEGGSVERVRATLQHYCQLKHPSLIKSLDVYQTDSELVMVEEHVVGVTLGRLQQLAFERQISVPIGIGVRLVADVLRAALALRQHCTNQHLSAPTRLIFPDSVVIASYGEAMLSGIGVTEALYHNRCVREHAALMDVVDPFAPLDIDAEVEHFEVFTAGAMLWQLLVIRGLFNNFRNQQTLSQVLHSNILSTEYNERLNLCVPKPIASIVRRATQRNPKFRYSTLQELLDALDALSRSCFATDADVRTWLGRVARDLFSHLQHDSGIRRIPLPLPRSGQSSNPPPFRESIDTVLPGSRFELRTREVSACPVARSGSVTTTSPANAGPESAPATAVRSSCSVPARTNHSVRRAYFVGTLIGIGLALGLSQAVPRATRSGMASGPSEVSPLHATLLPRPESTTQTLQVTSPEPSVDAGVKSSSPRIGASLRTARQAKRTTQQADTPTAVAPSASPSSFPPAESTSINRWGI